MNEQVSKLTVEKILADPAIHLQLHLIAGRDGLKNEIVATDLSRPGMALAGYRKYFHHKCVQVFGKQDISYLQQLGPRVRKRVVEEVFRCGFPCGIVTWSMEIPIELIEAADKYRIPLLSTPLPTSRFIIMIGHCIESKLAPATSVHGGLVDVYGVGVLLLGKSGVGKSECALELIERGHRLVADDVVEIKCVGDSLIGSSAELIQHHMEIRGLGIINIRELFGARSIAPQKEIELVANLEAWKKTKEYDRLGLDESTTSILRVTLPQLVIPVRPGRNVAVIIEVAAMNYRLKRMGCFSAREFNQQLLSWMRESKRQRRLLIEKEK